MTAVRPYYLLGQQQLAQLEEQVRTALTPIAARWWPAGATLQTVRIGNFYGDADWRPEAARYFLQREQPLQPGQPMQREQPPQPGQPMRSQQQWLALFGSERTWLALAEGWLGCQVAIASELVQTLLRTFCSELFTALAFTTPAVANSAANDNAPELHSDWPWSRLPDDLLQPGAGTLLLELTIDNIALKILTSAALWPSLATPSTRRSQQQLTPCNSALGACRVHLSATLPTARIPLTDIVTLAAGDFLNLGHDLSGRVQLQGTDISLSLAATVGHRETRKAIRLTGIKNETSA